MAITSVNQSIRIGNFSKNCPLTYFRNFDTNTKNFGYSTDNIYLCYSPILELNDNAPSCSEVYFDTYKDGWFTWKYDSSSLPCRYLKITKLWAKIFFNSNATYVTVKGFRVLDEYDNEISRYEKNNIIPLGGGIITISDGIVDLVEDRWIKEPTFTVE
jgi:hypothetical protein